MTLYVLVFTTLTHIWVPTDRGTLQQRFVRVCHYKNPEGWKYQTPRVFYGHPDDFCKKQIYLPK